MKIKCFSKRKLNVRISKTKIKCAILGFSDHFPKIAAFWENPEKIGQNLAEIQQHPGKFCNYLSKISKTFSNSNV